MIVQATKACTKCGHAKPLSEYHSGQGYRFGKKAQCKDCALQAAGLYRKKFATERKARKYGADLDLVLSLLSVPCCQACGQKFSAYGKERLDHCHERLHLRGVLCHSCNLTCHGAATEAVARMRACIDYLERDLEWQSILEQPWQG